MPKLHGTVTDFEGQPLPAAQVFVKEANFENSYSTTTDNEGSYELSVEKGTYYAVAILKDYTVRFLEYWAWNVPVTDTLELSPQIGGLELYALNAFRPQGAWPSLFVYFRPMSLARYRAEQERISEASEEEIVDIAPPLQIDNIAVDINGSRAEVVSLNPVREYVGEGNHMDACLVQVSVPDEFDSDRHTRIDIALHDPETDERGEATTFWRGHAASGH